MRSDLFNQILKYWLRTILTLASSEKKTESKYLGHQAVMGTTDDCSDMDISEHDLQEYMDHEKSEE